MALTNVEKTIGALGLLVGGANLIGAALYGYPVAYCLAAPYFTPIYIAWAGVVLYAIAAYTLYMLAIGRTFPALMGAAAFMAVIELPQLAHHVFSMGAACG